MNMSKLTDEALASKLAAVDLERSNLSVAYKEIGDKLSSLYEQRETLDNEIAKRAIVGIDPNKADEFTAAQWEYILFTDHMGNRERSNLANTVAQKYGMRFDGYNRTTQQRALTLVLIRDNPAVLESHKKLLAMVLPHIKCADVELSHGDTVSAKYLSIFDRGMSEYAVYFALVNEEAGIYWACHTRYSRTKCDYKFASLDELLDYLNKKHYYETGSDEE
jgi:hypothetical protein